MLTLRTQLYIVTATALCAGCGEPTFEDEFVPVGGATSTPAASPTPTQTAQPDPQTGPKVLLVGDGDRAEPFLCVLDLAGWSYDRLASETGLTAAVDLSAYTAVALLNGWDYGQPMPEAGQQALVDYVKAGGGLVVNEWITYDASMGLLPVLDQVLPVAYEDFDVTARTYHIKVQGHPMTMGLEDFEVPNHSASYTRLKGGWSLVEDTQGHPMVAELYTGEGIVVWFAAANASEGFEWTAVGGMNTLFVRGLEYTGGVQAPVTDFDGDAVGYACNNDSDNDGIIDAYDNCPYLHNPAQNDHNGNGTGDDCE